MATAIRLARRGAKKRPFYAIVVADSRSPRDGRMIEKLGTYDPLRPTDHPERTYIHVERARYWLSQGAQMSSRVARLFGQTAIIPMPPIHETPKKSAPGKKAQERKKASLAQAAQQAEAQQVEAQQVEEGASENI